MSEWPEDVMDALAGLEAGDNVTITAETTEGEELEVDAHVTDAYYAAPEKPDGWWSSGELDIHLDATNDTVKELEIATHSLSILAQEPRPGKWRRGSFGAFDPEVEDGMVVDERWRDLGDITAVDVHDSE